MDRLRLPVNINDFGEVRRKGFYFVDKTAFIEELLDSFHKVNLFTRPMGFASSLNLSMFRYFFEIGTDRSLFDGTYISGNDRLCNEHMGKYPVIYLSFEEVDGPSFDDAMARLGRLISREAERFLFLLESGRLTESERNRYTAILNHPACDVTSLSTLAGLLSRYYGEKVIIFIDGYDTPLRRAYQKGYYKRMEDFLYSFYGNSLKGNDSMDFAVMTGCLWKTEDGINPLFNNYSRFPLYDTRYDDKFGFTEDEVRRMLGYYHLESHMDEMRKWYGGYRFGNTDVYCPWDVIRYENSLIGERNAVPGLYRTGKLSNELLSHLLEGENRTVRSEIEELVAGKTIRKYLNPFLGYDEMYSSYDNLWSVLYMTGYLTGEKKGWDEYELHIPNKEVEYIFRNKIQEWFKSSLLKREGDLKKLWEAIDREDSETAGNIIAKFLDNTISVLDPKGDEKEKEKFYHGFVSGLLSGNSQWRVLSNRESGDGYPDLMIMPRNSGRGMVIELKTALAFSSLDKRAEDAIAQIRTKNYTEYLISEGREDITLWGIAFYKKRCRLKTEKFR